MKNTSCLRITIAGMIVCGFWCPNKIEKNGFLKFIYHSYAALYMLIIYLPLVGIEFMHLYTVSIYLFCDFVTLGFPIKNK